MGKKKAVPPATEEEVLAAMHRRGRRVLIVNYILQGVTLLTAAASLVLYFVSDEHGLDVTINHIVQCALALAVFNVPPLLERKLRCYIPTFITVTLYIFAFAHFVLGEIFRAYDHVFLYDKILHTTGGVIFALLSFSVVWLMNQSRDGLVKLSPFFIVLFTFCFTLAVEYVWELIEFAADRLFGANMQRWQDSIIEGAQIVVDGEAVEGTAHSIPYGNGLRDSMEDMIVNVIGCLAVCVFAYIGMKKRPNWFENKVILTEKQFRRMVRELADRNAAAAQVSAEGAQAPADAEQIPADGAQAPADGAQVSADAEQIPAAGRAAAEGAQALPGAGARGGAQDPPAGERT